MVLVRCLCCVCVWLVCGCLWVLVSWFVVMVVWLLLLVVLFVGGEGFVVFVQYFYQVQYVFWYWCGVVYWFIGDWVYEFQGFGVQGLVFEVVQCGYQFVVGVFGQFQCVVIQWVVDDWMVYVCYVYVDLVGMVGFQVVFQCGVCLEVFVQVVVGYCFFVVFMYCYFQVIVWVVVDWGIGSIIGYQCVYYDGQVLVVYVVCGQLFDQCGLCFQGFGYYYYVVGVFVQVVYDVGVWQYCY